MLKNYDSVKEPRKLLFIFEFFALLLLITYQKDNLDKYTIATGLMFILIIYISNYVLIKISRGDNYIFLIATMLVSIGIMMIFRIDRNFGAKQLIWISVGILGFYLTYFILKGFKNWDKYIYLYLLLAYGLFASTFILGTRKYGAINWISIKGISFQPAEIIKIILVFILASYYSNKKYMDLKNSSYYLLIMGYSFIGLLFLQKDLGMSLIFYTVFFSIQFIYEENRKIILYNFLLSLLSALVGYLLFNHVQIRVKTWLNPWIYINDKGYQITQSLFAIAEGGFFGKGLGLGHPYFIPLSYNDFIFSAICEEMGIFTGIGIIMLFMILVYRGFKIGLNQRNKFYRILALGISILFGIQSIIIIGGVTKLIPLTGITLPFISYGGSSLLTNFIALAVLQVASEDGMEGDINE